MVEMVDLKWYERVPMSISFEEMYILVLWVKIAVEDSSCPEPARSRLKSMGRQMAELLFMSIEEITPEEVRECGWDRAFGVEV
jgi:hypothetical protein